MLTPDYYLISGHYLQFLSFSNTRLLLDTQPLFILCVNTLLQFDAQPQLTLSVLKHACYFSPGQYFQFLC